MNRHREYGIISESKTRSPIKSLTRQQVELLHQSHLMIKDSSLYFFSDENNRKILEFSEPIARQVYKELFKIRIGDWQQYNPEDIQMMPIEKIISLAKYEGFDEENMIKFLSEVVAGRFYYFALNKNRGASITDTPLNSYKRDKLINEIAAEIKKYGYQSVENFYFTFPYYHEKIYSAKTLSDLNSILNEANTYLIGSKDRLIMQKVKSAIKDRQNEIKNKASHEYKMTKEEKAKEYYEALKFSLDFLRFATPAEQLNALSNLPEKAIQAIAKLRDAGEFLKMAATSRQLAELFWPIRLGRKIKGVEKLGLTQKMIDNYAEKILDKRLRTESAGYWFERKTNQMPRYELNPNLTLINTIKALLEGHQRFIDKRTNQSVKLMILINDNLTLKIEVPVNATTQDIIIALRNGKTHKYQFSLKDKYELKRQSYKSGKKSKKYEQFYEEKENLHLKLFGRKIPLPFSYQKTGDYIIRLTTKSRKMTTDINSPFSLFAVDSHKGLIDIDLNNPPGFSVALKLAHSFSDGKSTKPFFKFMFDDLKRRHQLEETIPQINFLQEADEIQYSEDIITDYPLFEANASAVFHDNYHKAVINFKDEKLTLSPNIIRTAVLDLANDVYDSHVLFVANANPQTAGPYDNVQPIILSLYPIKDIYKRYKENPEMSFTQEELKTLVDWIKIINKEVAYAKKGLSPAAVLSAPTGTAENTIAKISKIFHQGVNLLKSASGMFSPLPELTPQTEFDDTLFYTAKGDSYEKPIDLNKPQFSIGNIGYNHTFIEDGLTREEQIAYSVRKSPSQAQKSFKEFIEKSLKADRNKIKKINEVFTQLINAWEKLIIGSIDLQNYQEVLDNAFEKLTQNSVCGKEALNKNGINSPNALQRQLNIILQKDAAETIDQYKLTQEKQSFYGFLEAVNQQLQSFPDTFPFHRRS